MTLGIIKARDAYLAELKAYLAALDKERDKVLREINSIRDIGSVLIDPLESQLTLIPQNGRKWTVAPDYFGGMQITQAILRAVKEAPYPLRATEIADVLWRGGLNPESRPHLIKTNVYSALKRIRKARKALRRPDGTWALDAA